MTKPTFGTGKIGSDLVMTPQNVVIHLLKGKHLHEARLKAIQICKLVTEIEYTFRPGSIAWRVLQQDDLTTEIDPNHRLILNNLVQLLSKAL